MRRTLFVLFLNLYLSVSASGQEARGAIAGRVMDPSGAAIPGARVEIRNAAMGVVQTVTTNEAGLYQALFLIPGQYEVSAEQPGFKKLVRRGVEVRVNETVALDLVLELGSAEQSITVVAEAPLLNTASASLGQIIDSRRVAELPVAHGNPYQLIGLAAGVTFTRDMRLDRPFEPTHIVGYTIDGTRANRSDITLDGAPSTATANPGEVIASYVPPADVVAEFKVQTATFDASFGQTEGGVTNISMKSGTNAFHGTAYYNKMVPELFANDFFANAIGTPRPDFTYDRWGGSLGGPLLLPKLYNGRNRTFFFYGYEGIKEARPRNNGVPTVPTAKMKAGDFSDLLNVSPNFQIYNPFTRRPVSGGRFQQDPFPGNVIPAHLINPVARNILKYFPNPLSPGNADGTHNYQRPELQERIDYATHSIRTDHVVSEKQRLFLRLSWYDRDSDYNNYFNNLSTGNSFQFVSRAAVFDDVYTLSPSMVLNVRYGYNRFIRAQAGNPAARGFDLTSLGFPASYANAIPPDIRQFPRIDIAGYQGTAVPGEFRPNDLHSLNASVQKAAASHFLKWGMEFRAYRENATFFSNDQVGRFNFDATWTRGPFDNSPTSPGQLGQSFASFLLGLPSPSNSFVTRAASYAEQSTSWGFFLQDDWKVTPRLTLNLGLRWEFEGPLTERFNRSVRGFDPNVQLPFSAEARARYAQNPTPEVPPSAFNPNGGLTFAAVNGQPRGLYDPPLRNLMPRFGLAYRIANSTVLRGGYGMFYGFLGQRRGDVIQSGFSRNTQLIPSLDNGLSFIATLSNPFPDGILEPLGASQGPLTFVGQSITFFNEKPLMPYMQRWQFGIQHELKGGFLAEAAYVGNRGTHIEIPYNLSVTPQRYLSTLPVRDNPRINYLTANVPNPFFGLLPAGAVAGLTANNIARERLLRPYPHFDSVNASRFDGYSWYHSLQMSLEKRFSRGYTLNVTYTFSKFMQATELLNQDDARPTEVISDMDRPHRLAASWIYELPFGRKRRFGAQFPAVPREIISGWQISGIYAYQSGSPINFGNIIFTGDARNLVLPSNQRSVARWFNVDAGFERNAALQLDRNVRTFPLRFAWLRTDAINNWDLSAIKNTRLAEGKDIQFRAEFLNALNHPLLPAPNTNPTVVAFGAIQASTQANYARRIQLTLKFIF
jgi:hypothetical protein